jgi:translation initiation factor 3 subunit A
MRCVLACIYKHKQTLRKEIEEKELEEAKAFLAQAKKRKGKKGKKATRDGVSSFCNWLSF